jgi:hypothetical protein
MEKIGTVFALFALLSACSSEDDNSAKPAVCSIGELRGTWRISYTETDGTCGAVADETAVLDPNAEAPATGCEYHSMSVSDDKCRMDMDYTCPLAGGVHGSQRWTGSLHQTDAGRLAGSITAQVTSPAGPCRSTYDVTWSQQ